MGNRVGCNRMLGSPILKGSKLKGRPGVHGVEVMDDGILWCFAMSKGEGEHWWHSWTWSRK
jgi:hypothetical protein